MKTYAHINSAGDILGIGMIYFEGGGYTPRVAELVAELGEDAGILAVGEEVRPHLVDAYGNDLGVDPTVTAIVIDTDAMPGGSGLHFDKTFRDAFKRGAGVAVDIDIPKAKGITHSKRRAKREKEFAPYDEIIAKQIPGKDAAAAEAARAAIRARYDAMQAEIDVCATADALKTIIVREGL